MRIHNPSPGHGGPTQDTCLRTAVLTSSDLAYIPGCNNMPEEMWLIGTWP